MTGASKAPPGDEPAGAGQADDGYDALPYPSMAISQTQPSHLAALAALFGLPAPDAAHARVLELGCASGGNIIPLAVRFPQASFTGIDLSLRHIAEGQARIAAAGLGNITLHHGSLATARLDGPFDYIVCHGVFSWVPRPVQDAILRICRDSLAPDGMATISYNVLPGWHLRMVIRDLALHYAGQDGSPWYRVARARAALERIARSANAAEPYGLLLRTEADRLKGMPAAYILGEFLAPDNAPCSVQDFIGRAGQHGLRYVCEADLSASVPQALDRAARDGTTASDDAGRAEAEQRIDILTGRPFRQSVLVRHRQPIHPSPPGPDRLRPLHIASRINAHQSARAGQANATAAPDPAMHQALTRLAVAYPATLTLDELAAGQADSPLAHAAIKARICDALLPMVLAGQASISSLPLRVGAATQERPTVWRLARMEVAAGLPWMTSLRHAGVPVHPVLKALVPCMDGTQDRSALELQLAGVLRSGAVQAPELPECLEAAAERLVGHSLRFLARHALLEPDAAD